MKGKKAPTKATKNNKNNKPQKNVANSTNENKASTIKKIGKQSGIVKLKNAAAKATTKKPEAVDKVVESKTEVILPATRMSNETILGAQDNSKFGQKSRWINKQRVMIVASRGITYRDRHLMNNLKAMMPHSKSEPKMDTKDPNDSLNEMCEIRNCNKVLFFENRKRKDLYLWASNVSSGPSVKFLVENVHTMEELRMTGNSLKSSRPLLSFDKHFEAEPHYALMKELFVQIFGIPKGHPKSQPFYDHILTFTVLDNRIWVRNYQMIDDGGSLAEIGPRFVLNPIKIFDGSFCGRILYTNPNYVSPNKHRILAKKAASSKYQERQAAKLNRQVHQIKNSQSYADFDKYDDIFDTIAPEKAVGAAKKVFQRKK